MSVHQESDKKKRGGHKEGLRGNSSYVQHHYREALFNHSEREGKKIKVQSETADHKGGGGGELKHHEKQFLE